MFAPFFVLTVGRRMHADAMGGMSKSLGLITCLKVLLNYLKKVSPVNK
jgi:hypothetical protein